MHQKRPYIYNRILLYASSFTIPFIIIIIALIGLHVVPFGDKTLIISDAKGLYINYLGYVGRFIRGLEGFAYSFEKGLGGNMMPHMNMTMINPFFAIIALFSISDYPFAFTLISALNFCTSGLTMYIMLADGFGHKRSHLIFSTSYALCGFLVANVFQVIFFTGVHTLPLMVMGLRKILQGKNPLLYIFSIVYVTITSSYFGFTLCVFSLLLFLVFIWLRKEELSGRKLSITFNYGISSLCAGLIPAFMWLPGYMGMIGGRANQTKITDFSFWEKMPFIDIFSKFFTGANKTTHLVDGLPNIFVGLLPVLLVILFFINKGISKRMKAAAGITLGFYLLGFYIIAFDMLLHGGTTTNWFHFRYSYVFSFIILIIAAYEWQYADVISFTELKAGFIGLIIAILLIFSKQYDYVMGSEMLLDIVLLLVIFLAYRLYRQKPEINPRHTFEAVVILVVSISLLLNYVICTKSIMEWGVDNEDFTETVNAVEPLISAIQKSDPDFYRMEINHQMSETCGNDPMLYGYNGVGHGGSLERDFVREELFKLGVQWYDMRNYYSHGIPAATDTLLGLRYLIADEDLVDEKDYIRLTDMKEMGLDNSDTVVYDSYKNLYALPIGFVANVDVNDLELTNDDLFDNLNLVWKAISGEEKNAFVEENDISFKSLNLSDPIQTDADDARELIITKDEQSKEEDLGSESESDSTDIHLIMEEPPTYNACVEFSFTASQDGPVYIYHRGGLLEGAGNTESLVKYMGYFKKGDTVKGYLPVTGDYVNKVFFEEYAGRFRAAYADLDALESMSETITKRPSTIEKIKENHLKGTVDLHEGQELMFTIPWDTGWTCYVDGQKIDLTKVLGVFMAADVGMGTHTFEMVFEPEGMNIGIMISIVAVIILLLYMIFGRRLINRILDKKKAVESR